MMLNIHEYRSLSAINTRIYVPDNSSLLLDTTFPLLSLGHGNAHMPKGGTSVCIANVTGEKHEHHYENTPIQYIL